MNRMSFVGLKRVGGGDIYIYKERRSGENGTEVITQTLLGEQSGRRTKDGGLQNERTCVSVAD